MHDFYIICIMNKDQDALEVCWRDEKLNSDADDSG